MVLAVQHWEVSIIDTALFGLNYRPGDIYCRQWMVKALQYLKVSVFLSTSKTHQNSNLYKLIEVL